MNKRSDRSSSALLLSAAANKGTAFSSEERERLGLRGLLPAATSSQTTQLGRALQSLRRKGYDIERYIFLSGLLDRNERLFYRLAIDHIEEIMPIIYTPTVGQASQEFAHIFRQPRGLYITAADRGQIRQLLDNWPEADVRMIVITDGERILGLGDLGANGMAIPIGKLSLYTAGAGIPPGETMPVMFDVGTGNEELRNDPLYLGVRSERLSGDAYLELMDEFVAAVQDKFPGALIQFEDFLTPRAIELLDRYRHEVLCFNDDIQGTAAVTLGGIQASMRITGSTLADTTFMFLGAGSAATGIGNLLVEALRQEGLEEAQARGRVWFLDSKGLVVQGRDRIKPHVLPYAHEHAEMDFATAVETLRPQVLVGATGHPGAFTEDIVRLMAKHNQRPVLFALSNPTSRAEATAEQVYGWTEGRAVFASGSPFAPVELADGTRRRPGQGNNAYVFPGIGLGAIGCGATEVSDGMFLTAARVLAEQVSEDDLAEGAIYPRLTRLRSVSLEIAAGVAEQAQAEGLATVRPETTWRDHLRPLMYDPTY